VLVVGTDALVSSFVDAGIQVVPLERHADAEAVVMGKDLAFNYEKLRLTARAAARTGRLYATNLDPQMPVEDTFDPGSGAMIMAVAYAARVEPQVLGKPSRHAAEMAAGLLGLPVEDIAMVGDAPAQDIAMGRAAGMRTVLVLTGIARADTVEALPPEHRPDLVLGSLRDVLGLL
jgi:ribonucleotide monophosphatase NagD (HAD superfamily)